MMMMAAPPSAAVHSCCCCTQLSQCHVWSVSKEHLIRILLFVLSLFVDKLSFLYALL